MAACTVCVGRPALAWAMLLVVLWCPAGRTDWVEIPHLKPSGGGSSHDTGYSTSPHLLSHFSVVHEPSTAVRRRWRPPAGPDRPVISDLLDYEPSPAVHSNPWVTLAERGPTSVDLTDDFRRVSMVNVSSKVDSWEPDDDADDEQDAEEFEVEEQQETQLLPFGNRYEEESIEASAPSEPDEDTTPHPEPGSTVEHFDDFDDYDERMHAPQGVNNAAESDDPDQDEYGTYGTSSPVAHRKRKPLGPVAGFGGFVEMLRRMQANFVLRTAHTIGDKIRTLAGLRDQLLSSIEKRIAALWAVPGGHGRRRVKRGWMDPHGADPHAMDFPSAEGALLTISFLTFAVFLIKLVLQVINTIKAKHYTYSTFTAATPVSGGVLVKRTRRQSPLAGVSTVDDRHLPAVLSAINSYKFT
ncbi:AGAP001044-PA-like protein [Anopheles sinensis]|uniref:AGAP001044-PA-like protein n=1 Tax=Anopheles sinensis TaxID=74873 RepID=A0A084VLT7_ANOSI|nr:AGAP001044-PA-like protein [Anopheles sinensis]